MTLIFPIAQLMARDVSMFVGTLIYIKDKNIICITLNCLRVNREKKVLIHEVMVMMKKRGNVHEELNDKETLIKRIKPFSRRRNN